MFFPGRGESGKEAREICFDCPVVLECQAYAQEINPSDGVWATKQRTQYR